MQCVKTKICKFYKCWQFFKKDIVPTKNAFSFALLLLLHHNLEHCRSIYGKIRAREMLLWSLDTFQISSSRSMFLIVVPFLTPFLYGMIRKLHTTGMHTRLTDKQTKNLAWRAWLCFCYVFSLNESSSSHGLVDSHAMDSSVPLKSVSALEVSSRTRKFGKEIKNQKRVCVSLELETSDIMVTHCSNEFEEVIRNHRKKQIKI